MPLRELIEKRNRLLAESRQIMQATELSNEQRAKVDAMLTDANNLKADIERVEASAEAEERSLPANRPPREGFDSSAEDNRTPEERNRATNIAFRAFFRGERFEQRDLTVAADGGVMIPTAALPPVVATRSAGSIYDLVGKMRTRSGEPVRVPLWDDTSNGIVLDSAAIGNGTDPTIAGVTVQTDGLRTGDPLLIDNKLIQDLDYDLVSYVNQSLQQRYFRGVSSYINAGNSSNFVGLTGNIPLGVTTASAGVIGYDDLDNLVTSLDPSYADNAVFSMSASTLGKVRGIKDSENRPIFLNYLDGATSGFVGQLFGFPVKINQYAPSVASNNVPITFGDHQKGYLLREVTPGLVIKQSAQRWIELNRLGVIGFARAGGAPTLANDTTYSPLQGLKVQ